MDDKAWDQLFTAGNKTIYKKDEVVGRRPLREPQTSRGSRHPLRTAPTTRGGAL